MARRRNDFLRLAEKIEAGFFAPFILGAAQSAQGVVKDLQKLGPTWSGTFANSWEIASPSSTKAGSGRPGQPESILAPILTPEEFKFKPVVKYTITNNAKHADYALDLKEGKFWPRTAPLETRTVVARGSRPAEEHKRGDVRGGEGNATSSAQLDWYVRYVQEKRLDKTIKLYMDEALRKVKL
jgi:hypothetical protein